MFPSLFLFAALFNYYILPVSSVGNFIQPPAAGATGEYQDNPSYRVGSTVTLWWNSESKIATDVVLIEDFPTRTNSFSPHYSTMLLRMFHKSWRRFISGASLLYISRLKQTFFTDYNKFHFREQLQNQYNAMDSNSRWTFIRCPRRTGRRSLPRNLLLGYKRSGNILTLF